MKVTPNTPGASASLFESDKTAWVYYVGKARVVEFPKVWRENGKQYKVTSCSYTHRGDNYFDDHVTIRAPFGATSSASGLMNASYEEY